MCGIVLSAPWAPAGFRVLRTAPPVEVWHVLLADPARGTGRIGDRVQICADELHILSKQRSIMQATMSTLQSSTKEHSLLSLLVECFLPELPNLGSWKEIVLLSLCYRRKPSEAAACPLSSRHCFVGHEFVLLAKLLAEWNLNPLRCVYQLDCDWQVGWSLLLSERSYLARLPSDVATEVSRYIACSAEASDENSPDVDRGNQATVLLEKEHLLPGLLRNLRTAVSFHRPPAEKLAKLHTSMHFVFLSSAAAPGLAEPAVLDHSAIAVVLKEAWLQGGDTRMDDPLCVSALVRHYTGARRGPHGALSQLSVSYLEQLMRLCRCHVRHVLPSSSWPPSQCVCRPFSVAALTSRSRMLTSA
jgi:hypothetical protein